MDANKSSSIHFSLKIEEKPGGGFIARSDDPNFQPIEAATKEELLQKIEIVAIESAHLSPGMTKFLEGVAGKLNTKVNVNYNTKVNVVKLKSGDPVPPEMQQLLDAETQGIKIQRPDSTGSPIIRASGGDTMATVLRVIAALLAVGLAIYLIFLRK